MVISSRTPEGAPGRCPVCGSDVRIEPSLFWGDAPCPKCGTLLWFVGVSPEERVYYEYAAAELIRERLLDLLSANLGVNRHQLEADPSLVLHSGLDSLDVAELMMELEEMDGRG
jgi:hypothetical protein